MFNFISKVTHGKIFQCTDTDRESHGFDYKFYTRSYADLSHLTPKKALKHYLDFGRNEGRFCSSYSYLNYLGLSVVSSHFSWEMASSEDEQYEGLTPLQITHRFAQLITMGCPSSLDLELIGTTKRPEVMMHGKIFNWLARFNSDKINVLEIGSRSVSSHCLWKTSIPKCRYTGFDVHPGENVDIVGDAHLLSEFFDENSFDLVILLSVFEHLAMPWVVAEEISRVLKVGGHVAIETHFSFSEHEQPWHFFQYNANALEILFNHQLGFEVIDSGHSNPMTARFLRTCSPYLEGVQVGNMWCHSSLLAKKTSHLPCDFSWKNNYPSIIEGSSYPVPPHR